MILVTSPPMPAILLCVIVLLSAASIGWAQGEPEQPTSPRATQSRAQALAEIRASIESGDDWRALGTLAEAAALPDRSLAAPAALGASEIAHAIDAFDVDEQEIPRTLLKAFEVRWLRIATDEGRWVDIRIYALDVASELHALLEEYGDPVAPALWRTFLDDPDPQMRAAATTLVPPAPGLIEVALQLLADGRSEEVSLAAGQRLCGPIGSAPKDIPTFTPEALARLQRLAINSKLPVHARADLAPCLRAEGSVQSRRALGVLLQRSPPALRRTLRDTTRVPIATQAP